MGIDKNLVFIPCKIAVLTVSDTRNDDDDTSGDILKKFIIETGHIFKGKKIIKDNLSEIITELKNLINNTSVDIILTTGGTGVTSRDVTPEAYEKVCEKIIPGFGELFRYLSFKTIGTSTIQSRAIAGVAQGKYLFALPGSPNACKDGWNFILKDQLDSRHKPCNFVELFDRLKK
ncbi:molybdopterin-binding protein [Alphaproteobacteria bacterium]|nr:molybdopterin-binding protein [Alphaproteobacteria bacterium]